MLVRRQLLIVPLAALLVGVVVVKVSVSSSSDQVGGPLPARGLLDGRSFVASSVVGRELVAGTELRLSFAEGRFSADAGCNDSDGGYRVQGGKLVTVQVTQTAMACPGDIQAQDDWFEDIINGAKISQVRDSFKLASGNTTIRFASGH